MEFMRWLLDNFGLFFGGIFMTYLYLVIRRLTALYDLLRQVSNKGQPQVEPLGSGGPLDFLAPLFSKLKQTVVSGAGRPDEVIEVIASELDRRVSIHFTALSGYINTLILFGFAGTIFGSIGAFNEMFQGLAEGVPAAKVFVGSWNNGLATALYTSLGAAAIGGFLTTLVNSRFMMGRAKRLESILNLQIHAVIKEAQLTIKKPMVSVANPTSSNKQMLKKGSNEPIQMKSAQIDKNRLNWSYCEK
jgi:hypothetical protein